MNDIDSEQERLVREFLGGGRTRVPPEVDARLRAALAREAVAAGSPRRSGWLAAAALLAGVAVVAGVWWAQRRDAGGVPAAAPGGNASERPQQDPKPDPARPAAPAAPAEPDPMPPSVNLLDAEQTLSRAAWVLVVELTEGAADGALHGKVLRVLRGEGVRPGEALLLLDAAAEAPERSFLDVAGLEAARGPLLVALNPAEGISRVGTHRAQHAVGALAGVPLGAQGMEAPASTVESHARDVAAAVRAELTAALSAAEPDVRAAAVEALCLWDGRPDRRQQPLEHSPWRQPELVGRLLGLCESVDPRIRLHLVGAVPATTGAAGVHALTRRCFDPCPRLRAAAARRLQAMAECAWLVELTRVDSWWAEMTYPPAFAQWRARAEQAARDNDIDDPLGTWQRQLDKGRAENAVLGTMGLGTTGDVAAIAPLRPLADHDDARVRAAAARSRVHLGDRHGHELLRQQLAGLDERAAVYALDMAATLETKEAFDLLVTAADDRRPLIRALACGALRAQRERAPHVVDALLAERLEDEAEMVRAAAR